jgi:CheY-like chemotaxis protein
MQSTLMNDLFASTIAGLQQQKVNGTLKIAPIVYPSNKLSLKPCSLIWKDGMIVYGGSVVPDAMTLAKLTLQQFKPSWTNSALEVIRSKASDLSSFQEVLSLLVKFRAVEWQQIKDYIGNRIIWTLEQIDRNGGDPQFESGINKFDLCYEGDFYGFDPGETNEIVYRREAQWQDLILTIPSIEEPPIVSISGLQNISDPTVRKHAERWFDGKRTLFDIAIEVDRDPLQLAQLYDSWMRKGWINFLVPPVEAPPNNDVRGKIGKTFENQNISENLINNLIPPINPIQLPVILAVDDSPIIQIMIKRALSMNYEVLQATKAMDAMNMLMKDGDRISLLILDLTMPDIDGLELCRTIRSIKKFKKLPIIMVTARDGFVNKIKGQIAGSDRYLTKPFEADELLKVVQEFIG